MASEAPVLRDDYGRKLHVGRTQDGEFCVSITEGLRSVMAVLSGERLAAFIGAVDREAMPGQPVCSEPGPHELHICAEGHTPAMPGQPATAATEAPKCPQPGCTADPATASGGLPPKWCTGDCSHGDGEPEADATDPFGGHEFAYESSTDLFRCTRCRKYEVTVREGDVLSPCDGDVPGEPMELNAY